MEDTFAFNRLLTEPEAAKYLKVSPRTVYGLRKAGELSCVKIGKRLVRYCQAELERYLREGGKSNSEAR